MQDSYRELFLTESTEYLSNIGNCLIKLEENPDNSEAINEVFRCTHTLKGMSATMGFDKLAQLSHQMEDLLDEVRNHRKKLSSEIVDQLFVCLDTLEQLLQDIRVNKDSHVDIETCMANLKKFLSGEENQETEKAAQAQPQIALEFDDKELESIKEARGKGLSIFKVLITLSKDCVMKEARAYLVLTNLKKLGEVLKSFPSAEDLKEGKFDFAFLAVLMTKETKETVRQELLTISEVDAAVVTEEGVLSDASAVKQASSVKAATAASYIKKIQSIRIPIERVDKIMNIMGELAIARIRLSQIVRSFKIEPLAELSFSIDRLISVLQDEIMQTRLLPVAYILDAFPRIVRDLARKENKEIDLEIAGSEIELDRIVLDDISDPLVHLVRNAVDHGIESQVERKASKKSPSGKLLINVTRQRGQIIIEVADDGKGVDFAKVGRVAFSKGLVTKEEAANLDEKRVLELIAAPGFSTADKVSDVSGRGVGLDAVKAKIEALGGRMDFETKFGVGSRFILTLPLTLAIIKAMLVKVENEIFAIPLMSIRETVKLREDELKMLQHFEVVRVRDEVIPAIRLNKEFGLAIASRNEEFTQDKRISMVIIEHGRKAIGLVVTQVLGEQDIVVKPLGNIIRKTKGIAGATILGDGRVALILDTMGMG